MGNNATTLCAKRKALLKRISVVKLMQDHDVCVCVCVAIHENQKNVHYVVSKNDIHIDISRECLQVKENPYFTTTSIN